MNRIAMMLLLLLLLVGPGSLLVGAGPYDLRLEVYTNRAIPGEDRRIQSISNAVTNRTGDILFLGRFTQTADWPARFGLFLKQAGALQKVIADGDQLPDGAGPCDLSSSNFPFFDLNENGSLAVVIPSHGILIRESSELKWAVRRGAAIQGTSLTVGTVGHYPFTYQERLVKPFLGPNGHIAFHARLSDASRAILLSSKTGIIPLATAGAPIPDRSAAFGSNHQMNQVRVKGDAVTFDLGGESGTTATMGIFQYYGGALRTVALVGDQIPQIGTITAIWEFESNSDGDVALAVSVQDASKQVVPQILVWSASKGPAKLVDSKSVPGWASAAPTFLTVISLDDRDRLFFTAGNLTSGGIYLSEGGIIEKIVADGDPSPVGRLTVTPRMIDDPVVGPPIRLQYEAVANGELEIAFMASSTSGGFWRPFLWSRGWLSPVGPESGEAEPQTGRLLDDLRIKSLADGGRLVVRGSLCCAQSSALFSIEPAQPAVSYIPFIALSSYGPSYVTYVDLVNHSPFPAYVTLELFPPDNFPGGTVFPQSIFLQPGVAFRSALGVPGSPGVRTGYLRVTTEGGARVSAEATVELLQSSAVQSETKLAGSGTTRDALIQLDSGPGGTALALSNPGKTGAQIQLELTDGSGQVRGVHPIACMPERQVIFMLSDFFKDLPVNFRGNLRLRSETPFLVTAMSMAGVKFAGLPVQTVPAASTLRDWGYANLYPGIVRQVMTSADGTVAFVTGDYGLRVVRDSQVYNPLLGESYSLRPFGSEPWILGFWDDELVFLATEGSPSLEEAVFSWKPGRLKQLFGSTTVLPDGTRIWYSVSPMIALTEAGVVVPVYEELPGSTALTALYRFDGVFRRLCTLPTPAGQTKTPSVEGLTARNADFAFVANYNNYSEVWHFSGGQLTKVTDSDTVLPDADQATSFGQVEVGPTGQVYFRALFENPGDTGMKAGMFRFDGQTVKKIALEGEAVPGFPQFTLASTNHDRWKPTFAVNADDQLVFQSGLAMEGKPSLRGDCFLLVEPGQSHATLIVPDRQALESGDWSSLPDFSWTDDGRLFFTRSTYRGVELWEKGALTMVADPTIPLDNSPQAGLSFARRFRVYSPVGGQPLLGLEVSGSQAGGLYKGVPGNYRSFVFPTVVRASDGPVAYESVLSVHNAGTLAAKATLSLIDASGIPKSRRAFDLSGGETKTIDIEEIGTFTGWARLEVTGGEVVAEETIRFLMNNEFVSEVHLPPAVPGRQLNFASGQSSDVLVNPRAERIVALALVNPYNEQQEITVELIGSGMEVKRQTHLLLSASGQKSVFLWELLGVAKAPDWIRIRSSWPVAATAISFHEGTMAAHSIWR
ncbi:MAG: hypothetical protein EHM61_12635 [Acidobacteria bacterium]|nr:MAG: hypothetical protein EHM61_12635 [Acidobacteriota bacterium]